MNKEAVFSSACRVFPLKGIGFYLQLSITALI